MVCRNTRAGAFCLTRRLALGLFLPPQSVEVPPSACRETKHARSLCTRCSFLCVCRRDIGRRRARGGAKFSVERGGCCLAFSSYVAVLGLVGCMARRTSSIRAVLLKSEREFCSGAAGVGRRACFLGFLVSAVGVSWARRGRKQQVKNESR